MRIETHHDIIGDVHGQYDKLKALMDRLGYESVGKGFLPPEGRKALFLGDLIDPKPGHTQPGGVKAVLEAVKAMCDQGYAECIMGNHELNAIYFHSKGPDGEWLRERSPKNIKMHQGTLDDYPNHEDPTSDWQEIWLPWMKSLPFYFENNGFRAVHATWDAEMIERVRMKSLCNPEFFLAAADKTTPAGDAMEVLLKGVEVDLPEGVTFTDHTGTLRKNMRARWWELPSSDINYDQLVFPANPAIPSLPVKEESFAQIPGYAMYEIPVFFGHYLKPIAAGPERERNNVACLDYSAAKGGPLVAYRWEGEYMLNPNNYVQSHES